MEVSKAVFIKSYDYQANMPDDKIPEFAFIGRSNVGKSSLINMICRKKDLAKTSSMPGKTKLINHFFINENIYFADLPGYGYARISKTEREKFEKLINDYILYRKNLFCLFILIDSRLEPQKNDIEFINKCGKNKIPICLIFTKTDKEKGKNVNQNVDLMLEKLSNYWQNAPQYLLSSANTGEGRNEIINFIYDSLKCGK